jgi:hypothetical protein
MQQYTEIQSSQTLSESLALLLYNTKTVMSQSSGTTFPTANLQVGMPCLRTDENKLYICMDVSLPTWQLVLDLNRNNAYLDSPEFTGSPTAPTQSTSDNSTKLATTAYVKSNLASYAPLASPALTGTPTAPTAGAGTNTTQLATTEFVSAAVSAALPNGIISMWKGTVATIPTGWALCDGNNGTPNLKNKFIVGAGATYTPGDTGGATSATSSSNGSHTHTITVNSDGSHAHTATTSSSGAHYHGLGNVNTNGSGTHYDANSYTYGSAKERVMWGGSYLDTTRKSTTDGAHTHTLTTSTGGAHTHTASSGSAGGHTHTVATLPPYYALAFIMKL